MSRKIAITTPTGNVGSKVAARLAGEPGIELLLLIRDPARVQDLVDRGARAVATDLGSLDEVLAATQGVDALFWLTPQNFQEEEAIVAGYQRYGRIAAEAVNSMGFAERGRCTCQSEPTRCCRWPPPATSPASRLVSSSTRAGRGAELCPSSDPLTPRLQTRPGRSAKVSDGRWST